MIKPQENSLKLQSMRAAFWSILGKGGSHVVRMAGSLILTRILFPEAFGLMATATVVLNMIQLFADTGVRAAIIQNPRGGETEFLNTAWIISICRGGLLFLIVTGLSWPMAYFYNQPDLKGLLFVMAFSPLLLGFENPALALFIKKFRVEKQVAFELGTQILGLITSIILSYIYRSVYALAFGTSISAVYRVAGSYMIQNFRPGFRWNRELGAEIFNFGKYIMLNTMITWAATNVDLMMIGKLLDENGRITVPGFYDRVQDLTPDERAELAGIPFDREEWLREAGVKTEWGEEGYTVIERTSARPTLDVNGIWGGYIQPGAKTVLPSHASAKISMRLVPNQKPDEIARLIKDYLIEIAPPTVTVEVRALHGGDGAIIDRDGPAVKAAGYHRAFAFGDRRPRR